MTEPCDKHDSIPLFVKSEVSRPNLGRYRSPSSETGEADELDERALRQCPNILRATLAYVYRTVS
jgi:hypothetical protein